MGVTGFGLLLSSHGDFLLFFFSPLRVQIVACVLDCAQV